MELTAIRNLEIYKNRMASALKDKMFFASILPIKEIEVIVDFGFNMKKHTHIKLILKLK